MNLKFSGLGLLPFLLAGAAHAVSLGEVIPSCGDDGKAFCPKASYGKPMQDCLITHENELGAACKGVVEKLKKGERVTLF